nr:uncharacterized protein CXorf38 homolog isoform X2 [Pelodiscus sinensis]|eukprot:XP_014434451.1 uncharacterized protein CXorf38 homolog isoform X2 [Pelodiscus sinensis]
MALEARLNCAEYKNWLKAGHCLLVLRDALRRFAGEQLQAFHRQLLARLAPLGCCRGRCRPRSKQFQSNCSVCAEWKKEILKHHTNKNGEIHWENCKPELWPSDSWELAKAYMPRGQMNISGPEKCDASALLNLFNFCNHFKGIDQKKVREVIRCRNELMHSSEMKASSLWMEEFGKKVENLLKEFQNVPEVMEASRKIEKNLNRIQMIKEFLKDNNDLQISLQADMQKLEGGLEEMVYNQKISMKDSRKESPNPEEDEGC